MLFEELVNSLVGKFIVGGTFVSGIAFIAKHFSTLMAAIFAGVPIGLPSSLFIDEKHVLEYLENLTLMTLILFIVTLFAYLFKKYTNSDKYKTIKTTVVVWVALSFIYYLYMIM